MIHSCLKVAAALSLTIATASPALSQEPTTPWGICAQQLGGSQNPYTKKWDAPRGKQAEHSACVLGRGAKLKVQKVDARLPTCREYKISLGGTSFEAGGVARLQYYRSQGVCR